MSTALAFYDPFASGEKNPDYLIPDHISLGDLPGSDPYDTKNLPLTTIDSVEESAAPFPIAVAPFASPLKGRFILLQLWEGRIVDVRDDEFDAIITDKTNPNLADELVTLDIIELSPDDLYLLKKGAIFYWSVGYLDYPGRGRVRESKIRFRRLKGWSKKEIDHAKKVGKQFAEFFNSNSVCSPQT